jgi:hypothetical protein
VGPTDAGHPSDVHHEDAHRDAPDAAIMAKSVPPLVCDKAPSECVSALPPGFHLVLYENSRADECPAPTTLHMVVSDPTSQEGACECACKVTSPSSCQGTVGQNCNGPMKNHETQLVAGCNEVQGGGPFQSDLSLTAVGGACDASIVTDDSKVSAKQGLLCTLPTGCEEGVCTSPAPPGFSVCLATSGTATSCPTGWGAPILVGDIIDLLCTPCACEVGPGCAGAAATAYSENQCSGSPLVALDGGGCVMPGFPFLMQLTSVQYSPSPAPSTCTATGEHRASLALENTETLCCRP